MHQPDYLTALDLPPPDTSELDEDMRRYFEVCQEKLGIVPNVLRALSFDQTKLRNFANFYNEVMLGDSGLSRLEREMIAVVVSSINHCYYCLVSHGQSVRKLSKDPVLGELLVMNYRSAKLSPRERAMLDFATKLTETPAKVQEADRQLLRDAGFSDRDIWDIVTATGFYNMTNRMSTGVSMMPNPEYHGMDR
ncbi:MAG: alkylhydroperoxidase [Comamonas sp. SCN 67-35]|uniref:peroxidase-related enzyme n=1 Tax=unclassified Comamonas TaxID=2638500 RepID=UPI00086E75E1|nr:MULTISPECIES: peroxidase-related enzyme [unclassified Comamonas]MBN9330053.1 peroxidase-related enzyme [Comamonas sp.]ODU39538.1 MAG: alkylhydroperoxidase [Comamonas sp. SCN 67-35]OJW99744.1 MAG: alkylhydroperoxidase [Burkholderiales bacterium 66-26]